MEWGVGRRGWRRSFGHVPLCSPFRQTCGWEALHAEMVRRVVLAGREQPGPAASPRLQKWAGEGRWSQDPAWHVACAFGRWHASPRPSPCASSRCRHRRRRQPPALPCLPWASRSGWSCPLPFAPSHLLQAPSSATSGITNCFLESFSALCSKFTGHPPGPLCSFLNLFSAFYKLSTFCASRSLWKKKKKFGFYFYFFGKKAPSLSSPPPHQKAHARARLPLNGGLCAGNFRNTAQGWRRGVSGGALGKKPPLSPPHYHGHCLPWAL